MSWCVRVFFAVGVLALLAGALYLHVAVNELNVLVELGGDEQAWLGIVLSLLAFGVLMAGLPSFLVGRLAASLLSYAPRVVQVTLPTLAVVGSAIFIHQEYFVAEVNILAAGVVLIGVGAFLVGGLPAEDW